MALAAVPIEHGSPAECGGVDAVPANIT
ncbi:hypothetical protein A2U01_0054390, partial [Trifolium medium]|nr:hypothetical protein [Trifolium medium]